MSGPRYRASINGFWCHNETWDDALNRDGWHDEVFFSVNTKVLDTNGAVLDNLNSESEVMGDAWQRPGRVQAGSASAWGGIVSSDKFPWPQPAIRQNGLNTTQRVPPYAIWEGELPPGQMVFVTPTIWEWDDGAGAWDGWLAWQKQTDEKYGQRAKEIFGKLWPVSMPVFDAVSLGIQTFASLAGLWSPFGQAGRRPVGLRRDPANPDGSLFNPYTIALNSDTAEYLVTSNPQALGNGIRELLYADDPYLRGVYSIFVQIEKLPGTTGSGPWPDGSLVRETSRPEVYVIFGKTPRSACPTPTPCSACTGAGAESRSCPTAPCPGSTACPTTARCCARNTTPTCGASRPARNGT
jgi:hypothetical protein